MGHWLLFLVKKLSQKTWKKSPKHVLQKLGLVPKKKLIIINVFKQQKLQLVDLDLSWNLKGFFLGGGFWGPWLRSPLTAAQSLTWNHGGDAPNLVLPNDLPNLGPQFSHTKKKSQDEKQKLGYFPWNRVVYLFKRDACNSLVQIMIST